MEKKTRKRKKARKRLKRGLQFLFVSFLVAFFRAIPRRAAISVGRSLGSAFFFLSGKHRKNTIKNLETAFGTEKSPRELERIARDVFRHFGAVAADAIRIPQLVSNGINKVVKPADLKYFKNAVSQGRGVIALTGHIGNWELLGAWMASLGFAPLVIGAAIENKRLDAMVVSLRNSAGYKSLNRDANIREIIRAIRDKRILGFLIDQDTKVDGIFAEFFGKQAYTPTGPIRLAMRYNVPVVPVFMILDKDLTYHVECFPEIRLARTGDFERDLAINIRKCNEIYEKIIREYPEQWVWMHRRWKRRPPNS